ncbi:acylphosphatase-1 isoform X1 [Suncus etruscus]|uniref:acylphosphatase-1 isoform X1 n=2 Tax=Suncus etruscus TaxID=109475 RepID=UPI0021107FBD|nr:acylphosphatase-1 isoform X1 [Suncus etruscus]
MLADSEGCPFLAMDGAPRCDHHSCNSFPLSAHFSAVCMLIAFQCTLSHFAQAPGVSMAEGDTLISVDYEVFGKVQGVFFRKYTQAESKKLGLVGWVQNTDQGTVQGQLQGPTSKVRHMQQWLQKKGSPKSHIERANFDNEKVISELDYSDFQIVK